MQQTDRLESFSMHLAQQFVTCSVCHTPSIFAIGKALSRNGCISVDQIRGLCTLLQGSDSVDLRPDAGDSHVQKTTGTPETTGQFRTEVHGCISRALQAGIEPTTQAYPSTNTANDSCG